MDNLNIGEVSIGANAQANISISSCEAAAAQSRHDFYFERCEDKKSCDLGGTALVGQGRILDVTTTVRNVCPYKRVALAIALTEVDAYQNEYPRGTKIVTIPAHQNTSCTDISLPSMRFVLPEDLSVSGSTDMCSAKRRHFIARIDAHYVDQNTGTCAACTKLADSDSD